VTKLKLPSLAIFDLDDTLYDYQRPNAVALKQLAIELSNYANTSDKEAALAIAVSRTIVKERLGLTASSHSRILYISEAFRQLQLQPDTEMFIKLEKVYWNTFLQEIELFTGVEDLLRMFQNGGTRLGLVTDLTSSIQYRKISKLGLNRIFDFILTSEESGGDKSTGLPFAILESFSQGDFLNAWFFGDSDSDYPTQGNFETLFFKKTKVRLIKANSEGYEFGDYSSLGKKIEQSR
jgi:putative hydrolase of the HAD superfamily